MGIFLFAAFAASQNSERASRSAQAGSQEIYLNMEVPSDFVPSAAPSAQQPSQAAPAGQEKTIPLRLGSGGLYNPSQITVNLNDKVTIVGDMSSLRGCTKALIIPAFGIAKVLSPSDNKVEFTASKKGTFPFSCSMGMVRGTIEVQ